MILVLCQSMLHSLQDGNFTWVYLFYRHNEILNKMCIYSEYSGTINNHYMYRNLDDFTYFSIVMIICFQIHDFQMLCTFSQVIICFDNSKLLHTFLYYVFTCTKMYLVYEYWDE